MDYTPAELWALSWPEFRIVTRTKELMLNPDKVKSKNGPSKEDFEAGMDETMRKSMAIWEAKRGKKLGET